MRVLLVSPYSLSVFGGVQGQVLGLARSLREIGVDARVVSPCDGPPPEPGIITVGPSTNFTSNGSIAPIAGGKPVARRTLEARRVIEPDVIHLHEPLVPGPTQTLLLGADEPLVGTFHASYSGRFNPWYRLFRPPLKRWLDRLAIRTAVSKEAAEVAQLSFDGEYDIVPNGVDVPQFAKATPWPSEHPTILFVGRHEPRKGLGVLLDAFAGLERDAVLWVAGEGPETDALRTRGVPDVEWIGRISEEEKARRLRAATVFCAPALGGESFGIVLLEAMSASTAVVASDIDGFRNVARADRDALLVEPSDAGALRDALRRLLDDASHRAELIASGEQRAGEFSMRHVAEHFVTLYEAAIERSAVTR
ncbi:MAG TPA: glycosyltransferase family 4 protein [Acidimicrobiia bacterium]|nr:glycosyltransferase family 4 protein [Acidimicrobiia bacterium]